VEKAVEEHWFETEWARWEEIRKRFEQWGVALGHDHAGGRLGVYAYNDGGVFAGDFERDWDDKPLQRSLVRLLIRVNDQINGQAA
jgi:hypothetical protein